MQATAKEFIIALDEGTTNAKAVVLDSRGKVIVKFSQPLAIQTPRDGWVEQSGEALVTASLTVIASAVAHVGAENVAALAISNQRETAIGWYRDSGEPITWQCTRSAAFCDTLRHDRQEQHIKRATGLPIAPLFSASKMRWLLDATVDGRLRAERGEICLGTIDSWLLWNLTGGKVHASDYSNCCRTMLFDIHRRCWDETLCQLLDVPMGWLPQPVENSGDLGTIASGVPHLQDLAGLPIRGAAGDQQAALFGQGCFQAGQLKNTYGTGCFTLMNTGETPVLSQNGLLTCKSSGLEGKTTYILEGSVFNAGSSIQWLRDELGIIRQASDCDRLAEQVPDNGGVYLVSAFTGLGAPHWDMYARGTVVGLTRGTTRAHLCRAALEGIAYQTADLIAAMERDAGRPIQSLRVDGGASVSDFMMQYQADLLGVPVERPAVVETTAWGAACLAGLGAGLWHPQEIAREGAPGRAYAPKTDRSREYARWQKALERAKAWEEA
mgnify:CR=1 FL=1